jgi:predicted transcriptional regulator
MTDDDLTPRQIAVLQAQLKAANERLLSIERQRERMQAYIATLMDQLKRAESGQNAGGAESGSL